MSERPATQFPGPTTPILATDRRRGRPSVNSARGGAARADVIVVGGGPAGSTVAGLLAGFGVHVVLVEKRRFPRYRIGESLPPSIVPVLDFVGVRQAVERAGFLRMTGHTVSWGSPHPRTAYYSADRSRRGFQAWRMDFDALLLDHARAARVEVLEGEAAQDVIRCGAAGVAVRCTSGKCVEARFLIDATGHAGLVARPLRAKDGIFRTLALCGYWDTTNERLGADFANTMIESYEDGFAWSAALHTGQRNITLMVDWSRGSDIRRMGLDEFYLSELRKLSFLSGLIQGARVVRKPSAVDASLYTSSTFATDGFLLVGDAGLFIDPLSSEGVHKAMASAITAAAVVHTLLRRPSMTRHAIAFYDDSQRRTYQAQYRQAASYYREEQRWADRPFWARRAAAAEGVRIEPAPENSPLRRLHLKSRLCVAPGTSVEERAVIEGPFVELRPAVVAPQRPRGVRFVNGLDVTPLLEIVRAHASVADVIAAYSKHPAGAGKRPEHVMRALFELCRQGFLQPLEPAGTRSG